MNEVYLSIVIPAFNEEERIQATLEDIKEYLKTCSYNAEVIVVSDGSTDETADIVNNYIKHFPQLRLLSYPENKGKGFATKTGVKNAAGEWILFMDADNSTKIVEIERFWPETKKYNILFGSRTKKSESVTRVQPFKRKIISKFSNWLIRVELKTDLLDTQCGFKLFYKSTAKLIFDKLSIDRFGFDMEIVAIAQSQKIEIAEIAINWINSAGSKVRAIRDLRRSLIDLAVIKDNISKNVYH